MAQSQGMIHALGSQAFLAIVAWMQVRETHYEMTASAASCVTL